MAQYNGFELEEIVSFGAPLSDLLPNMWGGKVLERVGHFLARWCPSWFGYQFLIKCRRPLSQLELMDTTFVEEKTDNKNMMKGSERASAKGHQEECGA
jgi:hypothetical protein